MHIIYHHEIQFNIFHFSTCHDVYLPFGNLFKVQIARKIPNKVTVSFKVVPFSMLHIEYSWCILIRLRSDIGFRVLVCIVKIKTIALINDSETIRRVMLLIANISRNEFFLLSLFLFFIRISLCISIKTCVASCCSIQRSNVTIDFIWIFRSRTVACGAGCSRGDKLFGAFKYRCWPYEALK